MPSLRGLLLAAGVFAFATSCHTGSSSTAAGALITTGLAAGFSAHRRAEGDCYVDCLPGTKCNHLNGLCETLPCRGQCGTGESCEESFTGIKCIPGNALSVQGRASSKDAAKESSKDAAKESSKDAAAPSSKEGPRSAPAAALSPGTPPPAPGDGPSAPGPTPAPWYMPPPSSSGQRPEDPLQPAPPR